MFNSLWNRLNQWRSCLSSAACRTNRRPRRLLLRFEVLEDRLTPTNFSASITGTTLTLAKTGLGSSNGDLTITNSGTFQEFTVTTTTGNTITTNQGAFTSVTTPTPINRIVVKLGSGNDNLTFDGTTSNGVINLPSGLNISGTGGKKTITANQMYLLNQSALNISLSNSGAETATFTDVNVSGPTTVTHTGSGDTTFTINTSSNNATALNTWGSLSITNGTGSDINSITDTNFSGSVSISNGAGASGNKSQFGGSNTIFSAINNTGLLTVSGGLSIGTSSGQSDTEVYDYNVKGNLAITTGSGISGQSNANFVGVENSQTVSGSGIPVIGGSATITGKTVPSLNPGLTVDIGTDSSGDDFPLNINNGLIIHAGGSGHAEITLNDLTVKGSSSVKLGSSTNGSTVTILGDSAAATFGSLTITELAAGNNTFNLQAQTGTLNIGGNLNFVLTNGNDTVTMGAANGDFHVHNALSITNSITGSGGNKTFTLQNGSLGSLNMALFGTGSETSSFVDVNVSGAAVVTHTGTGNTSFTIDTTSNNANALNNWGSLSITNGTGADVNTIYDTDFAGSVSIINRAGASGNTSQFGGSHTVFSADHYTGVLSIGGALTITTSGGQSDSEVYDYNVDGDVTIKAGPGISGQSNANLIGLENSQTVSGSGIPVIGGSVTLSGRAVSALNPGFIINLGIDSSNNNYPLEIDGDLTITANGTGSAKITLNDLTVATGTTNITLGLSTHGNTVSVQGSSVTSVFGAFNLTSSAGGNNTYNFQDQAGELQLTGKVNVLLGSGNDTVNIAADSSNTSGVTNAIVELFSTSLFDGGAGTNTLFAGTTDTNVFFTDSPEVKNF